MVSNRNLHPPAPPNVLWHRGGGGEGESWTGEKVREATVHKVGRKWKLSQKVASSNFLDFHNTRIFSRENMQFYLLPNISNILGYILKTKHKIFPANFFLLHFFAKTFKANIYSYPIRTNERKNIYLSIFTPLPPHQSGNPQSLTPSLKSDP